MHLTLELTRTDRPDEAFIAPEGETSYVLRTEGGGVETATLDWSPELYADLDAVRRPGRDPAVVQRLGNRLRRFLAPAGWTKHEAAIVAANEKGEPVWITLRASAAELYNLPWGLLTLKSTGQHLDELPVVLLRYAWPETRTRPEDPSSLPEGGRILVGWSASAGGLPLDAHLAAIRSAAGRAHTSFDPARDVIDHLSLDKLASALEAAARSGEIVTVLHLICHGSEIGQSFGLAWDADDGSGDKVIVDAARLRQVLAPHAGRVRLVVLSACDSGNAGPIGNHLGSVAQNLHQAGVEAVIASRFPLSADGSSRFAEVFYEALLSEPASVERAFLAGRRRLASDPVSLDWAALTLHARPEDGGDMRPVTIRPYRGLFAFQPAHSRFFVGRDAERDELLSDLAALREGEKPRFLIVVGASGTGKSSVVLAGAVPVLLGATRRPARAEEVEALERAVGRLSQLLGGKGRSAAVEHALKTLSREAETLAGAAGAGFEVAVMRPGADPEAALAAALAGRRSPELPLLLVVDQLEEIFTHTADPAARQAFVARLWALASAPGGTSVITTLRVDFLGRCGEIVVDPVAGLRLDSIAYDEAHRVFVAQMKPAQMRQVIEDPAARVGLSLEAGLAARMIADVGAEPGALPLLEYTLDLLWQRRRGRVLSTACYEEIGGVFGALESMADRVLDELDEAGKEAARRMLPRLVGVGESGAGDTRQRVPVGRLVPAEPEARERCEGVLRRFVEARLLIYTEEGGEAVVEVAHEALIRRWSKLRVWLSEDRARLAEVAKLERWAADFKAHGARLQGVQLGYARQVREHQADALGEDALAMIAASEEAELAQAEAERREQEADRRRMRRIAAGAIGAAAVMLALGTSAGVACLDARNHEQAAKSAEHLTAALTLQAHGHNAWASHELLSIPERDRAEPWQDVARRVLLPYAPRVTLEHERAVLDVTLSPDGSAIATASADGKVKLWRTDGGLLATLDHRTEVRAVAFRSDGARLLTGAADGKVRIWDVNAPDKPEHVLDHHRRPVTSVAWSPDHHRFATASEDGTAVLWDATGGQGPAHVKVFAEHHDAVMSVAFDPKGERVVTASLDGMARVWSVAGAPGPTVILEHGSPVYRAEWSHDGKKLVTAAQDKLARIFDAGGGSPLRKLEGHTAAVSSATWSPHNMWILTTSDDNTARLWSAEEGTLATVLHHHTANVSAGELVDDLPDSYRVVLSSWDGTASLWKIEGLKRHIFCQPSPGERSDTRELVTWSRDGTRALSVSDSGLAEVWTEKTRDVPLAMLPDVYEKSILAAAFSDHGARLFITTGSGGTIWEFGPNPRRVATLPPDLGPITSAVWSPNDRLATVSASRVDIFPRDAGEAPALTLFEPSGPITFSAWSPDGQRLVTAADRTAKVWDLRTPAQPITKMPYPRPVRAAVFAPGKDLLAVAAGTVTYLVRSDGTLVGLHNDHDSPVTYVGFDADGAHLLVVTQTGMLRVCTTKEPFACPFEIQQDAGLSGQAGPLRQTFDLGRGTSQDASEATLMIGGADGIRRSYPWYSSPQNMAKELEGRHACLPARLRQQYFWESADEAERSAEACKRERAPKP